MPIRKKVGLVGYGVYIPRDRLEVSKLIDYNLRNGVVSKGQYEKKVKELINYNHKKGILLDPEEITLEDVINFDISKKTKGLLLREKAVCTPSQDALTMAADATVDAIKRAGIDPKEITHIRVGTESNLYAVGPIAATLAELMGANNANCLDVEFACTATANALEDCINAVKTGKHKYSLLIATDDAQAFEGDELEYSVGAGACALIFGKTRNPILTIDEMASKVYDRRDFWRREGQEAPTHTGKGTVPTYINLTTESVKSLNIDVKKVEYIIFHQPNGKIFVYVLRQKDGPFKLTDEEIKEKTNLGLVVPYIGNCYTAVSLIGLANVIENAKPGEKFLLVSYGSGAGSTALYGTIGKLGKRKNLAPTVSELINKKEYIDDVKKYKLYKYGKLLRKRFNKEEDIPSLRKEKCETLHCDIDDFGIGTIVEIGENKGGYEPIPATINIKGEDKPIPVVDGCVFKPGGKVKVTLRKKLEKGKEGWIEYDLRGTVI